MAQKLERGFVTNHPDKAPPKSPAGFEWPNRAANEQQRQAFQKTFANLIRTKAPNYREFARQFYGEVRDAAGRPTPRTPGTVVKYLRGDSFPEENTARLLGAFFKVPLATLLTDDGTPFEPLPMIRGKGGKARKKKGNGHAGNGADGFGVVSHGAPALAPNEPPPPAPRPPKGAKPIQVKIETLPGAPDFVQVSITGTVPLDVGLGIVAFIERGTHRLGPRK